MVGISWVGMPRPAESAPCGSKSTARTLRPYIASAAARLMVVVVLPTPPFWLHSEMMRAGPCPFSAGGVGKPWYGRPVGPIGPSSAVFAFVALDATGSPAFAYACSILARQAVGAMSP